MHFTVVTHLIMGFILAKVCFAEPMEFRVKHDHSFGSCEGKLLLSDRDIQYEASNGKHSRSWAYIDIQRLDVVSPVRLVLKTFESHSWKKLESDKVFEFSLLDARLGPEQQEFIREKLKRPMVGRLAEQADQESDILLVRHRHRLGGCEGQLLVKEQSLTYLTDHATDNRVWLLREVESLGSPDPFHLRLTTYNETFTFDLKAPLDPKIYDSLWKRVYDLSGTQAR